MLALEVERDVFNAVAVPPRAPDSAVQPLVVVQLGLRSVPGNRAEPRRQISFDLFYLNHTSLYPLLSLSPCARALAAVERRPALEGMLPLHVALQPLPRGEQSAGCRALTALPYLEDILVN